MATESLPSFLYTQFPTTFPSAPQEKDLATTSAQIYPETQLEEAEKENMARWLDKAAGFADACQLKSLNTHLASRTTILGHKPSVADLAVFHAIRPLLRTWTPEQRTGEHGYHHVVRHADYVQNADVFKLRLGSEDKVEIDPADVRFVLRPPDAKAEKERKKKEKINGAALPLGKGNPKMQAIESEQTPRNKEQAAGSGQKKANAKPSKAAPVAPALSPRLIDLRVGHILKAIPHPDADSLYISTIACGDAAGTENTTEFEGQVVRTVCSGLNGLIPLEEMQSRKIVAVCNLKPVKMRGVLSSAMVLAASPRPAPGVEDLHGGPVELVEPPAESTAGDQCFFEGWEGQSEGTLNPKKKIFESLAPGFGTDSDGNCVFERGRVEALTEGPMIAALMTQRGICAVKSLQGALVR